MTDAPRREAHARGPMLTAAGCIEGYLSLLMIALPLLCPTADHPGDPTGPAIYVGVAFGLALGGVRFGTGGSRVAAWIALTVLGMFVTLTLILGIVRWDQVRWYWGF